MAFISKFCKGKIEADSTACDDTAAPHRITAPASLPNMSVTDLILGLDPRTTPAVIKPFTSKMDHMKDLENRRDMLRNKEYMMYKLKGHRAFV